MLKFLCVMGKVSMCVHLCVCHLPNVFSGLESWLPLCSCLIKCKYFTTLRVFLTVNCELLHLPHRVVVRKKKKTNVKEYLVDTSMLIYEKLVLSL